MLLCMFSKLHLPASQPPSAKLEINLFALLPVWVWSMWGYYIYQAITTITSQCNGCWHITIHHPHPGYNDVSFTTIWILRSCHRRRLHGFVLYFWDGWIWIIQLQAARHSPADGSGAVWSRLAWLGPTTYYWDDCWCDSEQSIWIMNISLNICNHLLFSSPPWQTLFTTQQISHILLVHIYICILYIIYI